MVGGWLALGDEGQGQGVARSHPFQLLSTSAPFFQASFLIPLGPPGFLLAAPITQLCPQREKNFLLNSNQKTPKEGL